MRIVNDLSMELLAPLGASRAKKATVEAFTETTFLLDKRKVRPDGIIRVSYGKTTWTCLVEVKTGNNQLAIEQINDYLCVARNEGFDHVLTISNEIQSAPGVHPTSGFRVRANSKVQVSHYSWTAVLTTAVRLQQHAAITDPEQAWILGELIRYLEHPKSGALSFSDMGPNWVAVRDAARSNTLIKKADGVADIADRFDQLLRFASLKLGSEIGTDVTQVLTKAHRDRRQRTLHLVDRLCEQGVLNGALRIPRTAGDLEVTVDLRAQQVVAAMDVTAPTDRGARGRVSWLAAQLKDAPAQLELEALAKNARTPTMASLGNVIEDRVALLDEDKREPIRFRLILRGSMGVGRTAGGKRPGFIDSVLELIERFYGQVVQDVTPWTAPAPKIITAPERDDGLPATAVTEPCG